jgi:predicted dehydrogenase
MKPLKVALVGCGRMGSFTRPELRQSLPPGWLPLSHAEAIVATPGLQLDSVCDTNKDNLERACRAFGVRGYAGFEEQFAETKPDIVAVATRSRERGPIIMGALGAKVSGLHCEKPLATSMQGCRSLLGAMRDKNVPFTYGTTRRFMDVFRQAHAMVTAGDIGQLREIEIRFGRTLLLWNHPHSVDLMLFFAGSHSVGSVRARISQLSQVSDPTTLEDDPIVEEATVLFDNGVIGRIVGEGGMCVALIGSEGVIAIGEDGRWLERSTRGRTDRIDANPTMSGTARAFLELKQAIRKQALTSITAEDVEIGTAILLAIAASGLRGGTALNPRSVNPEFTIQGRFGNNYV